MELSWIFEVLRRRKWVIIQSIVIVTAVALLGSFALTPVYEATSTIMVKTAQRPSMGNLQDIGLSNLSSIITVTPNVDITRIQGTSAPYIQNMIQRLQLRNDDGNLFTPITLTSAGLMTTIRGVFSPNPQIGIAAYLDTDALIITANSPNAEEAAMMAATLAEIMVDQNQVQMRAEFRSARDFIEDQIEKIRAKYVHNLASMTRFQKESKTIDLAEEIKLAISKMGELLKQKEDNIIDLAEAHERLKKLQDELAGQKLGNVSPGAMVGNPQIGAISKELSDLRLQLTEAQTQYTDRHPKVRGLREQIASASLELQHEIDVYRKSAPDLMALERDIAALQAHLKGVNQDVDKYMAFLQTIPDKAMGQAGIDMELKVSQGVYSTLLNYQYQIGVAEATTLSEIRIIAPAIKPIFPASPNKLLNTSVGMFLGVFFGLGMVFLSEYLDDTIRTSDDLKAYKPIDVIGNIPWYKSKNMLTDLNTYPGGPVFESYRAIRNYLKLHAAISGFEANCLLIASPGVGEGKSTVVANLGVVTAHEGKRVLVIDLDLSRPTIHNIFNISNRIGVSDVLMGKTSLSESVCASGIDGLSVIPSGPIPHDAARLIDSDAVGRLVSDAVSQFDQVIIDSAPILFKNDAIILSKYSNAMLVIIESGKTQRYVVHQLVEMLQSHHIQPLGFVINKLSPERGSYYKRSYDKHGYYSK